jgi:hypothetical protein
MSAFPDSSTKVRLKVDGGEPGTEIFVIDGAFNLVDKGLETLDKEFQPGLYKVKFKRGSVVSEVDATLFPESQEVTVRAPDMEFSSPAPLQGTQTSHEYHQYEASQLSRQVHQRLGGGGQLFIFIRDINPGGKGSPASGLTLHDIRGRMLADCGKQALGKDLWAPEQAKWAGANIELDPGEYRLRLQRKEGNLEQILTVSNGWQTQIFLVRDWNEKHRRRKKKKRPRIQLPDLSKSTVLIAPMGAGFDPNRNERDLALTELARQGLTNGRTVLRANDLRQMLEGKFENPMLGIYGVHLLLRAVSPKHTLFRSSEPPDDQMIRQMQILLGTPSDGTAGPQTLQAFMEFLTIVINNLENLLGDHPDIRALRLARDSLAGERSATAPFSVPPMLYRSWMIVVEASATDPALVPSGSLSDRIANRLWGTGPCLTWKTPSALRPKVPGEEKGLSNLNDFLESTKESYPTKSFESLIREAKANPLEQSVLKHLLRRTPTKEKKKESFEIQFKGESSAALDLGLPPTTINWAAQSLVEKLKGPSD